MGNHLRVLSESYLMSTNMTGFRWFLKIFASLCFGRKAFALEGLNHSHLEIYLSNLTIVVWTCLAPSNIFLIYVFSDRYQQNMCRPKNSFESIWCSKVYIKNFFQKSNRKFLVLEFQIYGTKWHLCANMHSFIYL